MADQRRAAGKFSSVPEAERFWAKVDKRGPDECWPWTGARSHRGYGIFGSNGRNRNAQRTAWELTRGPIPPGEGAHGTCVCHACDNRACCNPSHLFLGSHRDNMLDASRKGRVAKARGTRNGNAKLTPAIVAEMRARANSGVSYAALGRDYGVTRGIARKAVLGLSWGCSAEKGDANRGE